MLSIFLFSIVALVVVLLVVGLGMYFVSRSKKKRQIDPELGRKRFSERREWLEADFFSIGAKSGSPRGLSWTACDFDNDVCFALDKRTGELTALVAVGIQFEAIVGGEMEEVEAVANQKAATAVFRFDGQHWQATGKAVFNLSPSETIEYYQNELETIEM